MNFGCRKLFNDDLNILILMRHIPETRRESSKYLDAKVVRSVLVSI